MLRIRINLPRGRSVQYTNVDVVKDAAINMLEKAGVPPGTLVGVESPHWGVAPICTRYKAPLAKNGSATRLMSQVVVSTTDAHLAQFLAKAKPEYMRKVQPATGESIDMTGATVAMDLDPIVPGGPDFIDAFALTPIAFSRQGDRCQGRWHTDVRQFDISGAVSRRLTKLAKREIAVTVEPDFLYLSGRRTHSVCVDIKTSGPKKITVRGLSFPFVISGPPEDLRFAWYAGIGERNRYGFGFFGVAS